MIQINPSVSGFQNVLNLVVAVNAGAMGIADGNVTLGAATTFSGGVIEENNTSVAVNAVLDTGYSGTVTVNYYRPTLDEAHTTPGAQIEVDTSLYDEEDTTAYDAHVKSTIAAALGLRLEDFEFDEEVPVPSSENNPVTVDIVPVAGSYIYQGAAFTVTFAALDVDVPLSSVITVTDLNGFTF